MADAGIASFEDLLAAARRQREPQRLLFVFAGAELPEDCTPEQRSRFEAGAGGALVPRMCVDKAPEELVSFAGLAQESRAVGCEWSIVFVAGLAGQGGIAPTPEQAKAPLERMVEAIKAGAHANFIPFDPHGRTVLFE